MDLSAELLVQRSGTLSLLSASAEEVNRLVSSPECHTARVIRVIEADRELSAHLLDLVNSPLFDFPTTVNTVGRAVTILGPRDLGDLTVAAAAVDTFKRLVEQTDPEHRFWERALYGAVTARFLSEYRRDSHLERFFVAGLLHDIGSVVLHLAVPNLYAQSLKLARHQGVPRHQAEKRLIGIDHSDVGGALARGWGLSEDLTAAISHHHHPCTSPHPLEAAVIHVADHVAAEALGDPDHEAVERRVWDCIAVPPDVLQKRRAEIDARVAAIRHSLLPRIQAA